jgi:hypothetical protein
LLAATGKLGLSPLSSPLGLVEQPFANIK